MCTVYSMIQDNKHEIDQDQMLDLMHIFESIDEFALVMKKRMIQKIVKENTKGWNSDLFEGVFSNRMAEKAKELNFNMTLNTEADIANYCMMLWNFKNQRHQQEELDL